MTRNPIGRAFRSPANPSSRERLQPSVENPNVHFGARRRGPRFCESHFRLKQFSLQPREFFGVYFSLHAKISVIHGIFGPEWPVIY